MDITPLIPEGKQVIQSYGGGEFVVNGKTYTGSILLLPTTVIPWQIANFEAITLEGFNPLLEKKGEVEILLVGTGSTLKFLPTDLKQSLKTHGIVMDVMNTGAACRTYNVLLAEERKVAAALIAI